jgi:mannose-6-phosphate isomerase-like protein (cupin superfamily)
MVRNAPRRVVTGHDEKGRAVVAWEDRCVTCVTSPVQPDLRSYEVWRTGQAPVAIGNEPDPTSGPFVFDPAIGGTVIRVADIPPDTPDLFDPDKIKDYFDSIGAAHLTTSTGGRMQPHPHMHRTETVDYGIVIEGELTLILDDGEVTVGPGDVVIQRGTNHAWSNRTDKNVRIAFVLVDGRFDPAVERSDA